MADLVVTYSRSISTVVNAGAVPVQIGSVARSESITIAAGDSDSDAAVGALAAQAGENIVDLYAGADCWLAIGAAPSAEVGSGRFMATGERAQYWVEIGETVSVVAA